MCRPSFGFDEFIPRGLWQACVAAVPVASGSCPVGNTGFRFSWPQCVVGRARTVFFKEKIKRYTEIAGFVPKFRCSSMSSGSSGFSLIHVGDAPRLKSGGFGCTWYGCAGELQNARDSENASYLQLMISDFYCEEIKSLSGGCMMTFSCHCSRFRSPNFGRTVMYRRQK